MAPGGLIIPPFGTPVTFSFPLSLITKPCLLPCFFLSRRITFVHEIQLASRSWIYASLVTYSLFRCFPQQPFELTSSYYHPLCKSGYSAWLLQDKFDRSCLPNCNRCYQRIVNYKRFSSRCVLSGYQRNNTTTHVIHWDLNCCDFHAKADRFQ